MNFTQETKDYALEMEKIINAHDFRLHKVTTNETESRNRDKYMRDYARVLYSSSFRRLQSKMQLLGIDNIHFHRNRLTHSLEVAQISRGIASGLGLSTTLVVETASLAHDIGNPPFGHSGEIVLNKLTNEIGGFEGNAQTIRTLTRLEKKHHEYRGLNLTFRTIMGCLKYFVTSDINPKKFIYKEDFEIIKENIEKSGLDHTKTIDCQIMDIADEIAYAAHDLEDSLSFGLLTIDELLYEFKISEKYSTSYDLIRDIVMNCQRFAFKGNTFGTSEEYSFLFRKELTSQIVNCLICDITLINSKSKKHLGFDKYQLVAEGLKKLLFKAISRKTSVQLYERKGEKIINGLFKVYMDQNFNKNSSLLPPEFRNPENLNGQKRNVADYIAGMMDSFAIEEYKKYFGATALNSYYHKG